MCAVVSVYMCVFLYLCVRLCGAAWKGLIKRSSFVDAARSRPSSSISTRLALRAFHFSESLKFEYDIISLMSFTITIMIIQHATPSIDVSTTQISSRATSNFRCCSCCCWFYCGSISALFFSALWQQFLYNFFVIFLTILAYNLYALKLKLYSQSWRIFNYPDQNQMQLIKCTSRICVWLCAFVCVCMYVSWRFHLFTVSHLDVFAFAHTKSFAHLLAIKRT